jgi:5-methylcytosine-specific restriction protein A
MTWSPANRAVRDQAELGLDLLFFERAQRKDGLWRFAQVFYYFSHKQERRLDRLGKERSAIVFGLLRVPPDTDDLAPESQAAGLAALRAAATGNGEPGELGVKTAIRKIYARSEAVRRYVLKRAVGKCEACDSRAPFQSSSGEPFLEVHHIDRLADNGPDSIDRVAAICPNCHRRCHHSRDRVQYNSALRIRIAKIEAIEQQLDAPQTGLGPR